MNLSHLKADKVSFAGQTDEGHFAVVSLDLKEATMATLVQGTLTQFHLSAPIAGLFSRAVATLRVWRRRVRERRALASLSAYDLHDIGLSQSDVFSELAKPFWRA